MKNIAVVCGGYTKESEVSIGSADFMLEHLSNPEFNCVKVIISQTGWNAEINGQQLPVNKNDFSVALEGELIKFDAAFNTLHGTPGENGLLQGYFDLIDVPYNTCDVLISALTFDKKKCNDLLKFYGIKSAAAIELSKSSKIDINSISDDIGLPCFVKPNSSGSSLGISKVSKQEQLIPAINKAFQEDDTVLIESFLDGVEVSCGAMIHNGAIITVGITEIVTENEFFDFEAKYGHPGTQEITPARISSEMSEIIQNTTIKVFELLNAKGFIRVDYIIQNNEPYLIEVNTTPGFSKYSILPQQLISSGYSISDVLINQIKLMLG